MSELINGSPVFPSWWQGRDRFASNISQDGIKLNLNFEKNALYAQPIWDQLHVGIKVSPIDFSEVFGNSNPLNLEIGIGNGEFIANYADTVPNENWLGVEVFKKIFRNAEKRANRVEHNNIRIIQFDAALILRLIPDGTLNSVYVNFPDPWPKAGHKKRRLLKPTFIALMAQKLRQGGLMHIATDHEDYASEITENIACVDGIASAFDGAYVRNLEGYFPTKYYRKFALKSGAYFYRYEKI